MTKPLMSQRDPDQPAAEGMDAVEWFGMDFTDEAPKWSATAVGDAPAAEALEQIELLMDLPAEFAEQDRIPTEIEEDQPVFGGLTLPEDLTGEPATDRSKVPQRLGGDADPVWGGLALVDDITATPTPIREVRSEEPVWGALTPMDALTGPLPPSRNGAPVGPNSDMEQVVWEGFRAQGGSPEEHPTDPLGPPPVRELPGVLPRGDGGEAGGSVGPTQSAAFRASVAADEEDTDVRVRVDVPTDPQGSRRRTGRVANKNRVDPRIAAAVAVAAAAVAVATGFVSGAVLVSRTLMRTGAPQAEAVATPLLDLETISSIGVEEATPLADLKGSWTGIAGGRPFTLVVESQHGSSILARGEFREGGQIRAVQLTGTLSGETASFTEVAGETSFTGTHRENQIEGSYKSESDGRDAQFLVVRR